MERFGSKEPMQSAESVVHAGRIVVALDASPHSYAALEIAARLARLIGAELHGLFVEDSALHQLGALPFSVEVGAYSATPRMLTQYCIPRELQALEAAVQRRLARVAAQMHIAWHFEVIQGGVTSELINAAQNAAILSLGRAGWSVGKRLGSTAELILTQIDRPILLGGKKSRWSNFVTTLFTGTPASERALQQAVQMVQQSAGELTVQLPNRELLAEVKRHLAGTDIEARLVVFGPHTDVGHQLWLTKHGLLVLPRDVAYPLAPLLDILDLPILLVP